MLPRFVILLAAAILVGGCAMLLPPNPYVPSAQGKPWGYAEAPVRPDFFEIGYVGPDQTTIIDACDYALVRAAEVAIQQGKPAFRVIRERSGKGKRMVYVEPTYMTVSSTDAEGNMVTEQVQTSGGYYEPRYYPMDTILIQLLDKPRKDAHDAASILHAAVRKGAQLEPRTLALLPPATAPSR